MRRITLAALVAAAATIPALAFAVPLMRGGTGRDRCLGGPGFNFGNCKAPGFPRIELQFPGVLRNS